MSRWAFGRIAISLASAITSSNDAILKFHIMKKRSDLGAIAQSSVSFQLKSWAKSVQVATLAIFCWHLGSRNKPSFHLNHWIDHNPFSLLVRSNGMNMSEWSGGWCLFPRILHSDAGTLHVQNSSFWRQTDTKLIQTLLKSRLVF